MAPQPFEGLQSGSDRITIRQRRRARTLALQTLYEADLTGHLPAEVLHRLSSQLHTNPNAIEFGRGIVAGVIRHLEQIGIDTINARVQSLAGWLLDRLLALRHANGRHMVRIYGPATMTERGATLTMNFCDPDGHLVDYRRVEELAGARRLSIRTGCFCNPGAGEAAEGLTEADMRAAMEAGPEMNLSRFVQMMQTRGGKAAGAIRVSFGLASNSDDAARFVAFAEALLNQTRLTLGDVTFDVEGCRIIRDGS